MTKFDRKPKPLLPPEKWEDQALHQQAPPEPEGTPPPDPNALPKRGYNLRLNDYELQELESIAKREDTSMQRLMRRILRNYLRTQKNRPAAP